MNYPSDVFKIYDVFRQDKLMVEHKPLLFAETGLWDRAEGSLLMTDIQRE